MFKSGQNVRVVYPASGIRQIGVIDKVSTKKEVLGEPFDDTPFYFVRVKEWDRGTNGGRWMGGMFLEEA